MKKVNSKIFEVVSGFFFRGLDLDLFFLLSDPAFSDPDPGQLYPGAGAHRIHFPYFLITNFCCKDVEVIDINTIKHF